MSKGFEGIREILYAPLFDLGHNQITLAKLVLFVTLVFLLFVIRRIATRWVQNRLLPHTHIDAATRYSAVTITSYFILAIGFFVILEVLGIDLSGLAVIAGALAVGIGFGLQNLTNNLVSGLIILVERPIKIGDWVEVGKVSGTVVAIRARSTTVVTNDEIAVIVPNSQFLTENVVNWSYTDQNIRFHIPFSVAYGSDVRLVEKILLEVANEHEAVLKHPEPSVRFLAFGDSALEFDLRVWTSKLLKLRPDMVSDLNFAAWERFRQAGVEVPFPQQDLHVRDGRLEVRVVGPAEEPPR